MKFPTEIINKLISIVDFSRLFDIYDYEQFELFLQKEPKRK